MSRRSGATSFEMVIGALLLMILGMALYNLFGITERVRLLVLEKNSAEADGRLPLNTLADHLRNAKGCGDGSVGVLNSVIHSASSNDITYYANSDCAQVRYYLTNGNLTRVENGVSSVVLQNVTSLSLTFYKAASYNSTNWTTTVTPSTPLAGELPFLAAIKISVTVTKDGYTSPYSTLVRLRNSPKKVAA